jgi:hypothetical protein
MDPKREMDPANSRSNEHSMTLYPCVPEAWLWLHPDIRRALGWFYLIFFSCSFFIVPVMLLSLLIPSVWSRGGYGIVYFSIALFLSTKVPAIEWQFSRKFPQLWYEIFNMSTNMSPEMAREFVKGGETNHYIIGMHPHGIIPFHGLLWAAFCDQYLRDPETNECLYGFGAVADVVMTLPVLRTIMGWLACAGAGYNTLKKGLTQVHI